MTTISRKITIAEIEALTPVDRIDVRAFYVDRDASDVKLEDDTRLHTFKRRDLIQLLPPPPVDIKTLQDDDYDVARPFAASECLLLVEHFDSIALATKKIKEYYAESIIKEAPKAERASARKDKRRMLEIIGAAPEVPDEYTLNALPLDREEGEEAKLAVLVATDCMQYIRLDCTAGITKNIYYNLRLSGFERSPSDVKKDTWAKKIKLGDVRVSKTALWERAG